MPPYDTINLHPVTHPPSVLKSKDYDVICIGSGWAGRIIAARVVKAGMTAVIIENELVGGDCPFWACVPSKVLLRPHQALGEAQAVGGVRERLNSSKGLDVEKVFESRDDHSTGWDDGKLLIPMVENSGAALVRGTGSLVDVKKVAVKSIDGQEVILQAHHAVAICTGSQPIIPDVPGLKDAKPWTPRHATSSSKVPDHLIILGAGAVGTEMATAYTSFGAKVSLVCSTSEILPKFDPEAGELVRKGLTSQGVEVYLSTKATSVKRETTGNVKVDLSNGKTLSGTEVLVAIGRRANTIGIGLEHFGVTGDGTPMKVDESLRVSSVPGGWLYAAGDVNGRAPLTHSSKYHGRIAANSIVASVKTPITNSTEWDKFSATSDQLALPQVVFTSPEVASVGFTRTTAKEAGKRIRSITAPVQTLGAMLRADGYEAGWAQWVVDEETGRLIGATMVGENVADLLHGSTVAIVGGMTLETISHAVPSFPTMSEVYLNLIEAAGL